MKKIFFLGIIIMIFVTGCGKKDSETILKDLNKKINNATTYQVEGMLQISNNEDTYNYNVTVSYEKPNKYRVSLINTSNDHEQIILKNDDGVYVKTHESTKLI